MTFSSIFPWKLLLLISISLFFEFIKADIYPLNSANPDEAFDSDASFPIIVPNDGSDNTGNIILGMSTRTKEPLDAPNDANLAPLYIANDKSNICEIQSSTIRRVRRDNKREPNACVMQTSPPASETKPEQNSAGDGPGVGKPPEKQPGKIPPFDPAREPSFSGFHFRENTSVCPHKSVTIPVCALQVDERDWATSTSVSFLSSLLECVAYLGLCPADLPNLWCCSYVWESPLPSRPDNLQGIGCIQREFLNVVPGVAAPIRGF